MNRRYFSFSSTAPLAGFCFGVAVFGAVSLGAPWVRAQSVPAEPAAPAQTAASLPTAAPIQTAAAEPGLALVSLPVQNLTDREAVQRALQHNPTLRAAELNLASAAQQLRGEEGRYPYSLLADAGFTRSESPQLRADDSVAASASRSLDASVGLRRVFPFGTVAEVRATEEYFNRDTNAVTVSPFLPAASGHGATVRASVTQPLLRGFGSRVGEAELRASRVNRTVAERALLRVRSALARDVESAYYELWYASRALEIEMQALALAREQERQAQERVLQGALSAAELLTFQTRTAEREETVVGAQLTQRQRSLVLSQLMGQMELEPPLLNASSEPVSDGPAASRLSLEQALATDSIEIAELTEQVRLAEVRAQAAGDASRPRLDAEGYVQSSGISDEFPRAWQRAAGLDWWSAHVGVSLELPLDRSREEAQQAQARLAVLSAHSQLRAAKDRVAAEAASALSNDQAARERLASAERTRAIAERAYEASVARYELGQTIAISLQQADDDLRRARLRVVRAKVDVATQRLNIEHLSGHLAQKWPAPARATE